MQILIDGYNLMFAGGLLGKKLGPDQFRKVRTRFLNDLAQALGPIQAVDTTVVFDASNPPAGLPSRSKHKGLTILFAVDAENADARIEQLLAEHGTPKKVKVVSTDRRVRQAASRRRAISVTADDFWVEIDRLKSRPGRIEFSQPPPPPVPESRRNPRGSGITSEEAAYWAKEFEGLEALPETQEALGNGPSMLTDEEIAEIEREVNDEPF